MLFDFWRFNSIYDFFLYNIRTKFEDSMTKRT